MTIELHFLMLTVVLGLVHLFATAIVATHQNGMSWAMGPRDEQKPLSVQGERLLRSYQNFLQTFPFFIAVILAAQVTSTHSPQITLGAELYFWARFAYIPVYVMGVSGLRTLIWAVSIVGIAMILIALL